MEEGKTRAITVKFQDTDFLFIETKQAVEMIKEIFSDNYQVIKSKIEFRPGDIILDAGANEGMFSIMMAKLFPRTKIIALEPVPETYNILVKNVEINACKNNIIHYNLGLGSNTQHKATLSVSKDFSGGSTTWCTYNPDHHNKVEVDLISLDGAFELYGIKRCRLAKFDCEGAEYDILYCTKMLPRIDFMAFEVHHNRLLEFDGRRPDGLINWVGKQTKIISASVCKMAE